MSNDNMPFGTLLVTSESEIPFKLALESVFAHPELYTLQQTMEEVVSFCIGYQTGEGYEPHFPDASRQIRAYMTWLIDLAKTKSHQTGELTLGDALRQVFETDEEFFQASTEFLEGYRK